MKIHFIEWWLFDSGFSIMFFGEMHLDLASRAACESEHTHIHTNRHHTHSSEHKSIATGTHRAILGSKPL